MVLTTKGIRFSQTTADCSPHYTTLCICNETRGYDSGLEFEIYLVYQKINYQSINLLSFKFFPCSTCVFSKKETLQGMSSFKWLCPMQDVLLNEWADVIFHSVHVLPLSLVFLAWSMFVACRSFWRYSWRKRTTLRSGFSAFFEYTDEVFILMMDGN